MGGTESGGEEEESDEEHDGEDDAPSKSESMAPVGVAAGAAEHRSSRAQELSRRTCSAATTSAAPAGAADAAAAAAAAAAGLGAAAAEPAPEVAASVHTSTPITAATALPLPAQATAPGRAPGAAAAAPAAPSMSVTTVPLFHDPGTAAAGGDNDAAGGDEAESGTKSKGCPTSMAAQEGAPLAPMSMPDAVPFVTNLVMEAVDAGTEGGHQQGFIAQGACMHGVFPVAVCMLCLTNVCLFIPLGQYPFALCPS